MQAYRIRNASDIASMRNQTHRNREKDGDILDGGNKERLVKGNKDLMIKRISSEDLMW